jgi:predicted metal-binding membrane protein
MAASPIGAIVNVRAPISDWFKRHPEWWMLSVSLGAWLLLALAPGQGLLPLCIGGGSTGGAVELAPAPFGGEFIGWVVMVAAMMPPLVVLSVRHVAFRSFWDRRHRAIAEFLIGYLGVWIAVAALLAAVLPLGSLAGRDRALIVGCGYAAAIGWQLTPWKRGALWRCHRTVALAPEGWRADLASVRFGLDIGASCLTSCWVLMALPLLASPGLVPMACIQAAMLHERYQRQVRPRFGGTILLLCLALLLQLHEPHL